MRSTQLLLLAIVCSSFIAAKCDFGQAIVNEAVDLFAAHSGEDEGDPRSLEDLLHWAISHSDPGKLATQAEEAQRIQIVKDIKEQRRRVKELLDHVKSQPTETDMMKEGVAILLRPAASDTELLAALQALQVLVEPIDNANDLRPLGGIAPVVAQLTRGSPQIAAAAAHVLGTAASNNPSFQRQLLADHPDVVRILLQVSQSAHEEAAVKGTYAVAALVRNTQEARSAFVDAGGFSHLELLLRGEAVAPRVKRKALSLFMDLVDTQPAATAAAAAAAAGGSDSAAEGAGSAAERGVGGLLGREAGQGQQQHFGTIRLGRDGGAAAEAGEAASTLTHGSFASCGSGDGSLALTAISTGLPEAVVSLLLQPDPDMQEKALLVLQRLAAEPVALQVLRTLGAGEALEQLQQQLRADAPKPEDEPDPYHDYLLDLSYKVASLMAAPASSPSPSSSSSSGVGRDDSRNARHGSAGEAAASGVHGRSQQQEEEKAGSSQPPLALGGPPSSRNSEQRNGGSGPGKETAATAEGSCGAAADEESGMCTLSW